MSKLARNRADENCRLRLTQRGFSRFEVLALESDRALIRSLARQLADEGPAADQTRNAMKALLVGKAQKPGTILAALRRSPLVGTDLNLVRAGEAGRGIDL